MLKNIADDFKASVEQHILSFTSLKDELKSIIDGYEEKSKTVVSKVDNIESIIKSETTILKSKIEVVGTNQKNQHDEIVSKLKSLSEGHIKAADNLSEQRQRYIISDIFHHIHRPAVICHTKETATFVGPTKWKCPPLVRTNSP